MGSRRPGDSIGRRYRILDTLGQGGMGTVHLAKDRLGGLVALKRLGTSADREALASVAVASGDDGAVPRRLVSTRSTAPESSPDVPTRVSSSSLVAGAPPPRAVPTSPLPMASTVLHVGAHVMATVEAPASHPRPSVQALASSVLLSGDGASDDLASMLRLTLAREFHLLASLRHPNIISVLDYGFDDDLSPYFTMELLRGAESIMKAGAGRSLDGKLDLLVQTLHALAYLHRRGVIHRDLKPGNVMVVGGQVKVLDFGVSTARERRPERGGLIVGTLAYMAPEVLQGAPASEASDLYALGTVAYELFAGKHPFDLGDLFGLRAEILHRAPDLGALDPRVAGVVGRLLEKHPGARHDGIDAVFADLATRTARPLVQETAATRESFLQAAELVGREVELQHLATLLDAAMEGHGGGALVGGESGVGKSRLLDELRAQALVSGMVVLRGQALRSGGPYHLFREVLRGMVLRTDLDDFEAGVLEAVVPDLDALIERAVPERAEIDPEAAHARLLSVVEALFRREPSPVLVILEDLQWAGTESLRLLARLATFAPELPLLFVGTYRDDERPDLPRELPQLGVLKLGRLTGEGIAALAASMLGEAGRRPEVIDRLQRETEGNPFFLVEVVRALAEDAGALSRVGIEPMPATLPAGGLHLIVRRRLDQVPRPARPLLEAAAVVGRQLDLALLRHLHPDEDLDAWIRTCANVAVLDFAEGGYRFAHDKLREGLLSALTADARRALHGRVAAAIEASYGDSSEQTMALAHHWALAGETENEARCSALAGEQALQSSAYQEAAAFFERAIAILSGRGQPPGSGRLRDRARAALTAIVPLRPDVAAPASDRFRLGRWEGRLSETYGRMANHTGAFRGGERALAYLGRPMPAGRAALLAGLPVQAGLRALMTLWPGAFAEPDPDGRALLLEATRIQTRITETCFYTQEPLPLLWSGLSMLNLGEPAGPSAGLACGYAVMAAVAGIVPLHPMAEAWSRRALELVESVGKPYDVAFVLQRVCSYRLWMGEWAVAEAGFERLTAIAKGVGDQRLLGDAMSCRGLAAFFQGQHGRVLEILDEVEAWQRRSGDAQLASGAPIARAALLIRKGHPAAGIAICRAVQPAIDAADVSHEVIRCHGVLALAHLRAGDLGGAREASDRALGVLSATRPVAYWTFDGTAATAEATLALWESSGAGADRDRARQACQAARTFATIFPIGRPFSLLWDGLAAQLAGSPRWARRAWNRAIAEAERLGMPYERGRAYLEIGRHLRRGDPERQRALSRAEAIFADLGADHDRSRALAEIRGG
jgi:serine/threonine protein kinase/tetratricopeptide (TPR) repeat protein